jgi:methylglyoxal synthase
MIKNIALIAHDSKKKDMIEWLKYNLDVLSKHNLITTGTTGRLIKENLDIEVLAKKSGPLGGDQEIGAMLANGQIDMLIFLIDPLDVHVHANDIGALQRLAVVYNIPTACNKATADMLISSSLFFEDYKPTKPDFSDYLNRKIYF